MSLYEDIKGFFKFLRELYPSLWEWILPNPKKAPTATKLAQRQTVVQKWRRCWYWIGLVTLLYTFTIVGYWRGRWWFLNFVPLGLISLSVTFYLQLRLPLNDYAVWRRALCGILCIWVPLLIPVGYWAAIDLFRYFGLQISSLRLPDPSTHFLTNGLTCLVFTVSNLLLAVQKSEFREEPTV